MSRLPAASTFARTDEGLARNPPTSSRKNPALLQVIFSSALNVFSSFPERRQMAKAT